MSKTRIERYSGAHPSFAQRNKKRAKTTPKIKICNTQSSSSSPVPVEFPTTVRLMLPDGTEPLDNQVAGHMYEHGKSVGMLKHKKDFILKPLTKPMCGEREIRFYEEIQSSTDPVLQELYHLVPTYHGTKTICVNGKEVPCLVLDDITKGLKEPCIIDIKIGRRTWDPLATTEKIQNEDKKYVKSKNDVGFSIPGFQVRNIIDGKLHKYGKDFGKNLNGETVKDALKLFLNADSGLCRPLLVQLLGLLWRILHWCRKQRKLRLYSSSLLLVYDARFLRHFNQNGAAAISTKQKSPDRYKRNRPPSLAMNNDLSNQLLCPGFSGQFTSDGPKFERSISANNAQLSPSSPVNNNCPWKKSLKKLQRTHSFSNNYEQDLQNLKQNYVYMLDDLADDSSDLWANVKMIDFAHVFPAEGNSLDTNYLEGIENLIKIFEAFLLESE